MTDNAAVVCHSARMRSFDLPSSSVALVKGQAIIRYVRALALGRGVPTEGEAIATEIWGATSAPARFLRAASSAGTTLPSGAWGDELVDYTTASQEFFGLVRERSIPGRMAGIRRTPEGVRLISQVGNASASWVEQGKAKPVSAMSFAADTMAPLKLAAICVVTLDLLKLSNPAAESWLKTALTDALVAVLNQSFIDPGNAGTADVEPPAITNGAPSVAATGTWSADLAALLGLFTGDLETAYFVTNGTTVAGLAGPDQPALTTRGGSLSGVPTIVDKAVPAGLLVLADASQIAMSEGALRVDASQQGSLEMETTPTGTATFSLWQSNAVALRSEQSLNWKVIKPGAAVVLTGATPAP